MKIKAIILAALLSSTTAQAKLTYEEWGPRDLKQAGWIFRLGYVIGGTSPIPLPNEIRHINGFKPYGGITFGADYYQMFSKRWGIQAGMHFFYEGFYTSADVKNYHMGISQGGNYLEGNFTGTDVTNTKMTGITIPITATLRCSPRWNISLGPFFSFLANGSFYGDVSNGYLREGGPTGQKVEITDANPATYDFAADMRHFYWGLEFLFDCKLASHINAFGGFDWSLSSIFPASFRTIDFDMYPLYAKLGVAYRL